MICATYVVFQFDVGFLIFFCFDLLRVLAFLLEPFIGPAARTLQVIHACTLCRDRFARGGAYIFVSSSRREFHIPPNRGDHQGHRETAVIAFGGVMAVRDGPECVLYVLTQMTLVLV